MNKAICIMATKAGINNVVPIMDSTRLCPLFALVIAIAEITQISEFKVPRFGT
jgi:hypothetical protein